MYNHPFFYVFALAVDANAPMLARPPWHGSGSTGSAHVCEGTTRETDVTELIFSGV
jgi:hypothetical protein